MNKRVIGDSEEILAVQYLEERGYTVIDRNFRCKMGEIDIVASNEGYLVFIEVKYRSSLKYGDPAQAVNIKKQRTIYKVAQFYILKNNISQSTPVRFDVVTIVGNEINIIKNAFGAM